MAQKLNDQQVQLELNNRVGWRGEQGKIVKRFEFKSFRLAFGFVTAVALAAERADHHPDVFIFYNKVDLKLSTHSAGGLTDKDFALADQIDLLGPGRL